MKSEKTILPFNEKYESSTSNENPVHWAIAFEKEGHGVFQNN